MKYTLDNCMAWIKNCEGYNSFPYLDTVGKTTIGWGRNLSANGISQDEAQLMFSNDFDKACTSLRKFNWFDTQPIHVRMALINMCFELGFSGLLKFKKMLSFIEIGDYTNAAKEALDSKWASQVVDRAKDVASMISEGRK